ncbi:unnamed protein product [Owenia fusiformis]|uniref:UDP-glucuronosyltransferase n=1 Tax=Owenia fusiformis TaxID=6347 RepID=A0A8J1XQP7_OWEFU|nr:unnamed protein product [Owenia fusiformis]
MDKLPLMLLYLCLLIYVRPTEQGKIIVLPMLNGFSSRLMNVVKLANMLDNDGHNVTIVFDTNMLRNPMFKNVKINTGVQSFAFERTQEQQFNIQSDAFLKSCGAAGWRPTALVAASVGVLDEVEAFMKSDELWDLVDKGDFDLILADDILYLLIGQFLHRVYHIPVALYINWGPFSMPAVLPPHNLAYMPLHFSDYSDSMTFFERLQNVYEAYTYEHLVADFIDKAEQIALDNKRIPTKLPILDYIRNISLIFVNGNNAFFHPRPYFPNVIDIQGFAMEESNFQPLSKELLDIITESKDNGLIIVSFGTLFRSLGPEKNEILAAAFAEMNQTVLWSFVGEPPSNLGQNTKLLKWIPQQELLAHPKTKLFVTHCGGSASKETIHQGVPIVGLPIFFDHHIHCRLLCERAKIGKRLSFQDLDTKSVVTAMKTVLHNQATYKENAKKMSQLVRDVPIPPRDKFLYWVKYVIRHKGAKHLTSQAMYDLNFFQYFLLDIAAFVISIITIWLVITLLICRYLLKLLRKEKIKVE